MLYAKQLAWLHSAPKRHDKDKDPIARINYLAEGHPAKNLPDINPYIAMCFQSLGICTSGGMGAIPLSWADIHAFTYQSAYSLTGWESEQLINMSRAYVNMHHKAQKLGFPPPYQEGITDEEALQANRDRVSQQWQEFESNFKVSGKR